MLAFRLLLHALRQITGNLRAALILGAPVLILGIATQVALAHWMGVDDSGNFLLGGTVSSVLELRDQYPTRMILLSEVMSAVLYLLMAVSWHRHVLLSESARLLTAGRGRQTLRYALTGLLIGLIIALPLLLGLLLLGSVGLRPGVRLIPSPSQIALQVVAYAILLRMTTALPGAAVGHPRPLSRAWRATRGYWGTFLLLGLAAAIFPVLTLIATFVLIGSIDGSVSLLVAAQATMSWLGTLIALSLLTTLWGHFVEGHALR